MRSLTFAITIGGVLSVLGCGSEDSQSGDSATGGESGSAAGNATGGVAGNAVGGAAGNGMAGNAGSAGADSGGVAGTQAGAGGSPGAGAGSGGTGGAECDMECSDGLMCYADLGCVRVCTESVIFTSETELEEFVGLGCQVLDGSLTVESPTLANLDGLAPSPLVVVTGDLAIQETGALTSIQGLSGLERVLGSVLVTGNAVLSDLDGLELLDVLGTDTSASTLVVSDNAELTSLTALGGVTELLASVVVSDNPVLTSLAGLGGVVVGSGVTVTGNALLSEFGGFAELEEITNLTVASNDTLESLDLPSLVEGASITITSNQALESIDLSALTSAGGLTIASNAVLVDLGTLEALTQVDTLLIAGNAMLPQCFVDALDARLQACTACQGNDASATCN